MLLRVGYQKLSRRCMDTCPISKLKLKVIKNRARVTSYKASCHFLPLRCKRSSQHPVLKHIQSVFFT